MCKVGQTGVPMVDIPCFVGRLLLDSRVVDVLRLSNLILVIFSSLKPLFFSGLKKAWPFSGNVGA